MTIEDLRLVWEGGGDEIVVSFEGVIPYAEFRVGTVQEVHGDGTATVLLDRPDTDTDDGSGSGSENGDWVVLKGKPWSCGCGASGPYMAESEVPHRIIVWPSSEDPNLVKIRKRIKAEDGEETSVMAYEQSMGPCVSHYEKTPS